MLGYTIATHQQNTINHCTFISRAAEAEIYAMGHATLEAQHIKHVLEEMAIPNLNPHITMSINTDSSAGKAVASRLGCVDKASTSDNNAIALAPTLSTDDATDSQDTSSFNIDKDDN
eukprot:6215671-Amphidinium_carterae.1